MCMIQDPTIINKALQNVEEELEQILKESLPWCDSDDVEVSDMAININKRVHELKIRVKRLRTGKN